MVKHTEFLSVRIKSKLKNTDIETYPNCLLEENFSWDSLKENYLETQYLEIFTIRATPDLFSIHLWLSF